MTIHNKVKSIAQCIAIKDNGKMCKIAFRDTSIKYTRKWYDYSLRVEKHYRKCHNGT